MSELLKGKTAAVTGGGRGIGEGIVLEFASNGANVIVIDLDLKNAEAVAEKAREYGRKSLAVEMDVTDITGIQRVIDEISRDFAPIDIWVNNAGLSQNVAIEDLSESDWDRLVTIDLKSVVFCSKAVFLRMKNRNSGNIINIASIAGQRGGRYAGVHYSAAKGGVITTTKCFALSGAPFNIRVNAIAPGLIHTKIAENLGLDRFVDQVPLGRLGTPEDIGKVALFLASDLSAYVTGQTISVNGGMYMT